MLADAFHVRGVYGSSRSASDLQPLLSSVRIFIMRFLNFSVFKVALYVLGYFVSNTVYYFIPSFQKVRIFAGAT